MTKLIKDMHQHPHLATAAHSHANEAVKTGNALVHKKSSTV